MLGNSYNFQVLFSKSEKQKSSEKINVGTIWGAATSNHVAVYIFICIYTYKYVYKYLYITYVKTLKIVSLESHRKFNDSCLIYVYIY